MQFKTFVNAVALVLFVSGAHAKVSSGTYSIVNKVQSSEGDDRAITFNGEGETVTVSLNDPTASKQWIVKDLGKKTQSISPVDKEGDQCAWGRDVVTILPAGNYVWTITQNDDGETIQDGGETVYWGLGTTDVDTDVSPDLILSRQNCSAHRPPLGDHWRGDRNRGTVLVL
ncbi:hypothetical protein K443DRAFT_653509 [Laccaria amethystina LaAM-08-1]|uniref:CCL2-like lectin domain-containing protein n=1 Tax=Laccaria amethystina LaAM-08-1 TaxID=1095629 RepID=A0A0C9X5A9_9AGAR|nr:hypothetical protein K443DRAFT_653509 [Laccaria amethystina LaAM-08-1]